MNVCPECGGEVVETIEGSSLTFACKSCGWAVARSWTKPINEDETIYFMEIVPGQSVDKKKLLTVSKIAGCNFIAAKKILEDGCDKLVSCKAPEMLKHREGMRQARVEFKIKPEFSY